MRDDRMTVGRQVETATVREVHVLHAIGSKSDPSTRSVDVMGGPDRALVASATISSHAERDMTASHCAGENAIIEPAAIRSSHLVPVRANEVAHL